jgi:acyl carrier protein
MEFNEVLKQVNEIFNEILENDSIKLTESTTSDDVEEWDSLTHIQLIVAIEKKFKIRFTSSEMESWNNVGEMIKCIQVK